MSSNDDMIKELSHQQELEHQEIELMLKYDPGYQDWLDSLNVYDFNFKKEKAKTFVLSIILIVNSLQIAD